jgi:hypothetical protein
MVKKKLPAAPAARKSAPKTAKPLAYHPEKELPIHRLPFVGGKDRDGCISFWNVPATGGYGGGCQTGEALAQAYLKLMADGGEYNGGMTQNIVFSMAEALRAAKTPEDRASIRGQIVSFFATLDWYLHKLIPVLGLPPMGPLAFVSQENICARANAGLTGRNEGEERFEAMKRAKETV